MNNKVRMNKKAILGETIGMFAATIAIILILILFAFGSAIFKAIDKTSGGVRNSKPEFSLAVGNEIKNSAVLEHFSNCEIEFNGKKKIIDVLKDEWNENSEAIARAVSDSGCSLGYIEVSKGKEIIVCRFGKCYSGNEAKRDYNIMHLILSTGKADYINNKNFMSYEISGIIIGISYEDLISGGKT